MARSFSNNWACEAISDLMRQDQTDAKEVAEVLSTQPRFLAAIQEVIDYREDPDYNPDQPGGAPAEAVVGNLIDALQEYAQH